MDKLSTTNWFFLQHALRELGHIEDPYMNGVHTCKTSPKHTLCVHKASVLHLQTNPDFTHEYHPSGQLCFVWGKQAGSGPLFSTADLWCLWRVRAFISHLESQPLIFFQIPLYHHHRNGPQSNICTEKWTFVKTSWSLQPPPGGCTGITHFEFVVFIFI